MAIGSITREPVELYDMQNDPNELENRVNDPALADVRQEMLEQHFSKLLNNINEAQLKVAEAGGIPTSIHQDYPAY